MGIAEDIGYEPSGREVSSPDGKTDLDLLRDDFTLADGQPLPKTSDVFSFADRRYGEQSPLDSLTAASTKSSFVVRFQETQDRLDPPFYLIHQEAASIFASLKPLGKSVVEEKKKFTPKTDAELDATYNILSVSSSGSVSLSHLARGEDFTSMRRVSAGDITYNPMRINIGSIGVVPQALDGGLVSPDYVVFRSIALDPDFLVTLLRSPFYKMYIDVSTTGSIRNRLYFSGLERIRVPQITDLDEATILKLITPADTSHDMRLSEFSARSELSKRIDALVKQTAAEAGDLDQRFSALLERWKRETSMLSSVGKKTKHPDYQSIIGLGMAAVPLILREMMERPSFWFTALQQITGENPAQNAKDVRSATDAWLRWGLRSGHLSKSEEVSYH